MKLQQVDLLGARLLVSGALFRFEKTNARTPGLLPGDPVQVLDGEQRVDGIEFSATGNISRQWMGAGSLHLTRQRSCEFKHPAEVCKRLINTPRNSSTSGRLSNR